ncbi:xylose isomerase [Salsuginibacillus kocurii]|uniref:xylose isomerase n=1 Tax=Salsuginibacillus kocurii TaxID=427078 RepID=UPI00037F2000|nr:xylose isomerase [Salsuginibacillus kocurii]
MTYFTDVSHIPFEGRSSANPLAFKYYDETEKVGDKTMKEWLRYSVAYWHTFNEGGADPFGAATINHKWNHYSGIDQAKARAEAAFEFIDKIGAPFFCFHDVDVVSQTDSLQAFNKELDEIVPVLHSYMKDTNTELLWNTANLFIDPRFLHGAATSSNADVFAYSAAKVKKQLEIGKELGAKNYVFWGGREGYESLLNTDMGFELDNLARFYHMAIDYAKEIGFEGQFLIEPKPKEPTKHQYDYDVASAFAFLQKYDLTDHFKINIEANHATLAGHSFEHELHYARANNMLGSVDANQGDLLLGWDTDEFPTDIYAATLSMYEILKNGGLGNGGLNFDAKVRRTSIDPSDLLHGHIVGMDTFAYGLKVAHRLLEDRALESIIENRYSSFKEGIGQDIVTNNTDFHKLADYAHQTEITNISGRQEMIRGIINQYILETN